MVSEIVKIIAEQIPTWMFKLAFSIVLLFATTVVGAFGFVVVAGVGSYLFGWKPVPLWHLGLEHPNDNMMPKNAVVAFKGVCPKELGWHFDQELVGRFVLGAGKTKVTKKDLLWDEDSNNLFSTDIGQLGGRVMVQIEKRHMPRHNHLAPEVENVVFGRTGGKGIKTDIEGGQGYSVIHEAPLETNDPNDLHYGRKIIYKLSEFRGQNERLEIMPPFLSLNYCIKMNSP